ncbi:hypothetical protein B7R54_18805 [Subtercola boreus]|uniref:Uncharacterized protein n=1 Tax=Subtercola boreus TaxID=120213 RepID=A0A3E0V9L2_9MICO|nr:hypothetical protein B7R54_18805 [Subtercola boreus]TQL46875.1 hypothetical protein FB464_3869 [Subtercola boreus]
MGVLASLLLGCTSQAGERTANTPGIASEAQGQPHSAPASVSPSASVPHDADQPPTSPEVGAEAISIASAVVTAFCRPALDRETWINNLYPFLSQTAAVAYGTVDPARVPCRAVTGDARVRDGDGAFTIRVIVPTDSGDYSVYVNRPEVTDPWLVEQVIPLAGD